MSEEGSEPVDFWGVLDEAEQTVEGWPSWQQRYEAGDQQENALEPAQQNVSS